MTPRSMSDDPFESETTLTPEAFHAAAAARGAPVRRFRKTGLVAARAAREGERVETLWNGQETVNTARAGDMVTTSLNADGAAMLDDEGERNTYVISAGRFGDLYEAAGTTARDPALGAVYRPTSVVEVFHCPAGFSILAPWGEIQRGDRGYVVLSGSDVYGVHADVFERTYEPV